MWLTTLLVLCASGALSAATEVSQGTITLKTYEEGLPDTNSPFDQFQPDNLTFFYPYSRRTNFTTRAAFQDWRALFLENEYLKCSVLPDLGGHLYTCIDKRSGRSIFHAADVVKKQWVGLRGAWISTGIELNFPVGHSWVSASPVDFGTQTFDDGSAAVWVADVDRVYGMQWRVAFVLRPGSTVLEQRVTLYNRSDVRRRYYWWSNGAVRLESNDMRVLLPTQLTATHNFTAVDTWPVNSAGVDLSIMANHKNGLGLFAHLCRESFAAAYHPATKTGLVHYGDAAILPGKKFWTWGTTDTFPITALTDNGSNYIEIQAGLFRDQSTYGILDPQQSRTFTEYWMPVSGIGAITRATPEAVLSLQRGTAAGGNVPLIVEFNLNRPVPGATVLVRNGDAQVISDTQDLAPDAIYSRSLVVPTNGAYTVQLLAADGAILLDHTEGPYNAASAAEFAPGPQPTTPYLVAAKTEQDYLDRSEYNELQGSYDLQANDYQDGLQAFPDSVELRKRQAILSVIRGRDTEGIRRLAQITAGDAEVRYYTGLAFMRAGDDFRAEANFRTVLDVERFARPAALQTAYVLSRAGKRDEALQALRSAPLDRTRAGAVEVALLRALDRYDEVATRLAYWRAQDPTDSILRYESVEDDPAYWQHLAAEPERVLNVAEHYMSLGMFSDALLVLDATYPAVPPLQMEPGAVNPREHPLVAYYRGYCQSKTGGSSANDYAVASQLSTKFVFASRLSSIPVLQDAIAVNDRDATAHYLLGEVYLSLRMTDEAISEWQRALSLRRDIPSLHRNLGRALLDLKMNAAASLPILEEGARLEPTNADLADALARARRAPR